MSQGTVVLLPAVDDQGELLSSQLLVGRPWIRSVLPAAGPDAALAARLCAAMNTAPPPAPLTIIATGGAALLLPAVALGQRAAHRRVSEYVLVEPLLPPVTDGWPDARVTVFSDSDQELARLRGWDAMALAELESWVDLRDP